MIAITSIGSPVSAAHKSFYQKLGSVAFLFVTAFCLSAFSSQSAEARLIIQYYEDFRGCPMRATWYIDDETGVVAGYPIVERMQGPCSRATDPGPGLYQPVGDFPIYDEAGNEIEEGIGGLTLDEMRERIRAAIDLYNSNLE